ncbi:MAG: helix-turn-helix domain-containing protein [Polyangiales bacterium]
MIHHVVIDGVSDGALGVGLEIVSTAERLRAAGLADKGADPSALRQRVLSLDARPVRSATGRAVAVDGTLSARGVRRGDVIVVPGVARAVTESSVRAMIDDPHTQRALRTLAAAADKCALVAASCSATFVLAAAGMLSHKSATTTWWLAPVFAKSFSDVELRVDKMVVESDRVLTAGSAFAHADLMLAVLARTGGPSLAHLVTRYLVLDERASQSRYMALEYLRAADPALRKLERFVRANLARQLSLDELAKAAALSPRTLARRVRAALATTPHGFVQQLRVERAAHLLETTRASVEEVAASVGYADPAAFRRVFRRIKGASPRETRARP